MLQKITNTVRNYSLSNASIAERFASPQCPCGGVIFSVAVDDREGAAVRTCCACGAQHAIGDSAEYLEEAELETCSCPCGSEAFNCVVGVSLYPDKQAVRWVYIGLACTACGQAAVYADWKNEHGDVEAWLALV